MIEYSIINRNTHEWYILIENEQSCDELLYLNLAIAQPVDLSMTLLKFVPRGSIDNKSVLVQQRT